MPWDLVDEEPRRVLELSAASGVAQVTAASGLKSTGIAQGLGALVSLQLSLFSDINTPRDAPLI